MLKVGITGGIGSGKSIVCQVFKLLGIPVYHADIEASILIDTNTEIRNQLINLFGDSIYNDKLKRDIFAGIIFKDSEALKNVNKIVHPKVRSHFFKWAETQKDKKYILFEAAILFESGTYKLLDKIITVTAPEKLRIERVMAYKNYSGEIITNILKNQLPDKEKTKQAHYIIVNDNKTLILPQILEIHNRLLNIENKI
jgi:dephospho-CoA kinase